MRRVAARLFTAFDFPDCGQVRARRPISTTPLQALATLNEPLSVEAAQALAKSMQADCAEKTPKAIQDCIREAFRRCTSRYPEAGELEVLVQLFETEKADPDGDAFLAVARVLLNLDETIVKS